MQRHSLVDKDNVKYEEEGTGECKPKIKWVPKRVVVKQPEAPERATVPLYLKQTASVKMKAIERPESKSPSEPCAKASIHSFMISEFERGRDGIYPSGFVPSSFTQAKSHSFGPLISIIDDSPS